MQSRTKETYRVLRRLPFLRPDAAVDGNNISSRFCFAFRKFRTANADKYSDEKKRLGFKDFRNFLKSEWKKIPIYEKIELYCDPAIYDLQNVDITSLRAKILSKEASIRTNSARAAAKKARITANKAARTSKLARKVALKLGHLLAEQAEVSAVQP